MVSLGDFYGDRDVEYASSPKITTDEDCERFWALSHTDYWTLSAPHNRPLQEFMEKCTG